MINDMKFKETFGPSTSHQGRRLRSSLKKICCCTKNKSNDHLAKNIKIDKRNVSLSEFHYQSIKYNLNWQIKKQC